MYVILIFLFMGWALQSDSMTCISSTKMKFFQGA